MPRPDDEPVPLLSILERLVDDRPRESSERRAGRDLVLARLKDALRHHLESLLNCKQVPGRSLGHPLLEESLLSFGLPDFSTANLTSVQEQERLRRAIETAVRRFEPRLQAVSVTLTENRKLDQTLRFRIDAMLRVEPAPEPVTFDSILEIGINSFVIEDGR
jgi:type VI secretion system protein ImpF